MKFVESQVKLGGYRGPSDYVNNVLRGHQWIAAGERLRAAIADGLASGAPRPAGKAYWIATRDKFDL
jgi:hypothetical protein